MPPVRDQAAVQYLEVVIVKLDSTSQVAKASYLDDPRIFPSGQDFGYEQLRQKKMSNVVGTKLGLDAISGGSVCLDRHHFSATPSATTSTSPGFDQTRLTTSIVDQDV